MVSKVGQQAQVTNSAQKPASTQPQKKENIVIEFSSLPNELKTKEVRDFYDKDGSGFLESNNWNGQDEVALMAKAFGLDLSKYKSNITKTVKVEGFSHGAVKNVTRAFDSNGKWIKDIKIYDDKSIATFETSKTQEKYSKVYREKDYSLEQEQNINPNTGGAINTTYYREDGGIVTTDYSKQNRVERQWKDKDGNLLLVKSTVKNKNTHTDTYTLYENKTVITGKNILSIKNEYQTNEELYIWEESQIPTSENSAFKLKSTSYFLNNEPVQAKSIGKGRYEITLQDGSVKYIAHDGTELNPEYVRSNP